MTKNYKDIGRLLLLLCFVCFPLVNWAQTKSVWEQPLKQCWRVDSDEMTSLKAASDNDKIIVLPQSSGTLLGIDVLTGKSFWKVTAGENFESELYFEKQQILFSTSKLRDDSEIAASLSLVSVNTDSGIANQIGSKEILESTDQVFVLTDEEKILIIDRQKGAVIAVDKTSQKAVWTRELEVEISTEPRLSDSRLYLGTANKSIVVLSTENGATLNQIPIGKKPSSLFLEQKVLFVGDTFGGAYAIETSGLREIWKTKTGGEITEIVPFNRFLLVSSNDNYEYAILRATGKKIWKRKLAGRILGKTIIDDEILVLFTHGNNIALFIDLTDGKIVNRIAIPNGQYFVSPPIYLKNRVITPTNVGLVAYSPSQCSAN